ncbi:Transcriptional adapter like [Thalictrum thalictroides]|uniref:Transcriptional adapter like n=1 Tax=Thalictrum thalictroides TaxID=46969 RepID=A0A7J6V024_THATH|nr:Transcriptional adapter like [Thalictrum thalictroides]
MVLRESRIKMGHSSRIDTLELKAQIIRKLGHQRADKYFFHLRRYFKLKIKKSEFDKLCVSTIGKENIVLHNRLIGSIIKNACLAKTAPPKGSKVEGALNVKGVNGYQKSSPQSPCGEVFPPSPRKARSSYVRDRKIRDRPSPLGPQGKVNSIVCDVSTPRAQEQQSATELLSLGSRPPVEVFSVEDGEEVEQMMGSPSIQSRSPLRAPFGVPTNMGGARKTLRSSSLTSFHMNTCRNSYELPDTKSLRNRLEQKLEKEGLGISTDCVNLLNNGLDTYLKRLIKPCIELSEARCREEDQKQDNNQAIHVLNGMWSERYVQRSTPSVSSSLLDFRVAMELNPQLLGEDWPVQLERVCLRSSEE